MQLDEAADWRGVTAQERAATAVAIAVRTAMPGCVSFVYCTLGNAYQSLGDFSKAIEYHTQHLASPKSKVPRRRATWQGREGRTGTSATRICRRGTIPRRLSTTRRTLRLQRRWGTGQGRAGRTGTSATRISRRGAFQRPSSTTRSTWRLQRRWGTGRGRARRSGTLAGPTNT
jgi:hypothetical protein